MASPKDICDRPACADHAMRESTLRGCTELSAVSSAPTQSLYFSLGKRFILHFPTPNASSLWSVRGQRPKSKSFESVPSFTRGLALLISAVWPGTYKTKITRQEAWELLEMQIKQYCAWDKGKPRERSKEENKWKWKKQVKKSVDNNNSVYELKHFLPQKKHRILSIVPQMAE